MTPSPLFVLDSLASKKKLEDVGVVAHTSSHTFGLKTSEVHMSVKERALRVRTTCCTAH